MEKYIIFAIIFIIATILAVIIFIKRTNIENISETKSTVGLFDENAMRAYDNVPGVWVQYIGNVCWNVCKTRNIGAEMDLDCRRIEKAIENMFKSDKRLRKEFGRNGSVAIRYRNMVRYARLHGKKIRFVVILTARRNVSDNLLEYEEMKFAVENKALAWNPAPGRQTKVYFDWKAHGGSIEKYKNKMIGG